MVRVSKAGKTVLLLLCLVGSSASAGWPLREGMAGPDVTAEVDWFALWVRGHGESMINWLWIHTEADGLHVAQYALPDVLDRGWRQEGELDAVRLEKLTIGASRRIRGYVDLEAEQAAVRPLGAGLSLRHVSCSDTEQEVLGAGFMAWTFRNPAGSALFGGLRVGCFDAQSRPERPALMQTIVDQLCVRWIGKAGEMNAVSELSEADRADCGRSLEHILAKLEDPDAKALATRGLLLLGRDVDWRELLQSDEPALRRTGVLCAQLRAEDEAKRVLFPRLLQREGVADVRWSIVHYYWGERQSLDARLVGRLTTTLPEYATDVDSSWARLASILGRAGSVGAATWFLHVADQLGWQLPEYLSECAAEYIRFPGRATWESPAEQQRVRSAWRALLDGSGTFQWLADEEKFAYVR